MSALRLLQLHSNIPALVYLGEDTVQQLYCGIESFSCSSVNGGLELSLKLAACFQV